MAVLSLVVYILAIAYRLKAGIINPIGPTPVSNSLANRGESADYYFTFKTETFVAQGGLLLITFPQQYQSGLGVGIVSSLTCNYPCTINEYLLTLTFTKDIYPGTEQNVTIRGIKNPSSIGGTGSFILRTYLGQNLLDENTIFGILGIAGKIGKLTSTLVSLYSGSLSSAGAYTSYLFRFRTSQLIPTNSYLKLAIPIESGFVLEKFPTCFSKPINNKALPGTLFCETIGNDVKVTGLSESLPSGTEGGIVLSIRNPPYSGITNGFKISIYRGGTQMIYDRETSIPGVKITPGKILDISLTKVDPNAIQAKNKLMSYELRFTPTNVIPAGGIIKVSFPMTFILITGTAYDEYYVKYGLEDISEQSPVGIYVKYDGKSNFVRITNFKPVTEPQEISLIIRMRNPNTVGTTTSFTITTYTDSTELVKIDEDYSNSRTSIIDAESTGNPGLTDMTPVTLSNSVANNMATDLLFSFIPKVTFPASGLLRIILPDGFKIINPFLASNCKIENIASPSSMVAPALCSSDDQMITIINLDTQTWAAGTAKTFSVTSQVSTPLKNGTYIFNVDVYDSDGKKLIESFSAYAIINPSPLVVGSLISYPYDFSEITVFDFSFTPLFEVPTGEEQNRAKDIQGFFQIKFIGGGWSPDLGTGLTDNSKIPCKAISGIVPVIDEDLICFLRIGTSTEILVKNFQTILANTPIRFHIPRIKMTSSSSDTITVNIIKKNNRIWTILNYITFSLTLAPPTVSPSSSVSTVEYTSDKANSKFDLTFLLNQAAAIASGDYIILDLPSYDIGLIRVENFVSCYISLTGLEADYKPLICSPYVGAARILIKSNQAFNSPSAKLKIKNLQWPRFVNSIDTTNCFKYFVVDAITKKIKIKFGSPGCSDPPDPTPSDFIEAYMTVPKKGLGYVDCTYYFNFKARSPIPSGSDITLYIPTGYNLLGSSPSSYFAAPQLNSKSPTEPLTFSPNIDRLKILNIGYLEAETPFTIIIYGLKNPSVGAVSSGWTIEIKYMDNIISKAVYFDYFEFGPAYQPKKVVFNEISAQPLNADSYADYKFIFSPDTEIPQGGEIQLQFPKNNYKELPSVIICRVSGGLNTFSSVTLTANTIVVKTNAKFTSGSIILEIDNVKNPDLGTTEGFLISTYYDGLLLDTTDINSLTGRTLTTVPKASDLSVTYLSFNPQNEAEKASYIFTFLPKNMIESNMLIIIQFPIDYHQTLSSGSIACEMIEGLVGTIDCYVQRRVVYISNFETYIPSDTKPITITVHGIINPNRISGLKTDYFKIGTLKSNLKELIDFNSQAGTFEMLLAPGWSTMLNMSSSNLYSRKKSNYQFYFNTSINIPKQSTGGAVFVDFPEQYDIPMRQVSCSTPTSDFAAIIVCNITRGRISVVGNTNDFQGELKINFQLLENPTEEGEVDTIVTRTYDGANKKIVQRTYRNLDPFSFTYQFPGPLIIVNNNEDVYVERGTQTKDLYISVNYPCLLNLTIKPTLPGFSSIPYAIPLSRGAITSTFRLSVPMTIPEGVYYIYWETLNDLIPEYYTPLKKTKVIIQKGITIPIYRTPILDIPYGGSSLRTDYVIEYSPDIGINIKLNFMSNYDGLSMSTSNVFFRAGLNKLSVVINSANKVDGSSVLFDKGYIAAQIEGVNKDIFALPDTQFQFRMISADSIPPAFVKSEVYALTRTTATLLIQLSEPAELLYMYALDGTDTPDFFEVLDMGPAAYATTSSIYSSFTIRNTDELLLNITGLIAQTPYVIYMYLQDRGGNLSPSVQTVKFQTIDRYSAVDFSLRINVRYLSAAERKNVANHVAFLLSVNYDKVIERKYVVSSQDTQTYRLLQNDESHITQYITLPTNKDAGEPSPLGIRKEKNRSRILDVQLIDPIYTLINLQVATIAESEVFPSPKEMVIDLKGKITQLKRRLEYLDTTYDVPYSEVPRYKPAFVRPPFLIYVNWDRAIINVVFDNYAWAYIVAMPSKLKNGTTVKYTEPSPFQIFMGYDGRNVEVVHNMTEIEERYTTFELVLTGLNELTEYTAFIVGGSVHPGYPDLMEDKFKRSIKFTTTMKPIEERLNINFADNTLNGIWIIILLNICVIFVI